MKSTNARKSLVLAAVGLAGAIGIGAATGVASPDPSESRREVIEAVDAKAREQARTSPTLPVYDAGAGRIVGMSKADVLAEQRRAAAADGYLDHRNNPRYVLIWENGRLVPGPALECTPSPQETEPDTCTMREG